jgi:phosphate uptake regulator
MNSDYLTNELSVLSDLIIKGYQDKDPALISLALSKLNFISLVIRDLDSKEEFERKLKEINQMHSEIDQQIKRHSNGLSF